MTAEPAHDAAAHHEPPLEHAVARLPAILRRFVTPEAVYGLVLYAAIVAAASDEETPAVNDASLVWNDRTVTISDSVGVLIWVVLAMIVFWGAHVFAHGVAGHGVRNGKPVSVAKATRDAFHQSSGMLYAPILPTIALLLGAAGILPDDVAIEATLWISVVLLGILGFLAFVAKHSSWFISILGGLATAVLGLLIILLNAVMH